MPISLHTLKPNKGSRSAKKRVGRGLGSKGTYSGRGVKGQRARSGGRSGLKLKGLRGLMLSTPKLRGFFSDRPKPAVLNVGDLAKLFANGVKVTPKLLLSKGLISTTDNGVKILAAGTIGVALIIEGCSASVSAKQKIEQAGGKIL